jgi:hypothetical protein
MGLVTVLQTSTIDSPRAYSDFKHLLIKSQDTRERISRTEWLKKFSQFFLCNSGSQVPLDMYQSDETEGISMSWD